MNDIDKEKKRNSLARKRAIEARKKRDENILLVLCSVILAVIISITWSTLTFITNIIIPTKLNGYEINYDVISMVPDTYSDYLDLPYAKVEYLDRYRAYKLDNPEYSMEDIITHTNMGIDVPFFTRDAVVITNPHEMDVLVNKVYKLPDGYVPQDLIQVDGYRNQTMQAPAASAFKEMATACEKLGFEIFAYSGYRSYDLQTMIFDNMVELKGVEYTEQYVSRPGHSEHATGLSMDVSIDGMDYSYIHEHDRYMDFYNILSEYGFIIRYPEGKEELTGYEYESWHIRYVGVELAKEIEESGLTLDEYIARQY